MITQKHIKASITEIKETYFLSSGGLRYPTSNSKNLGQITKDRYDLDFINRAYIFLKASIYTTLESKHKEQTLQDLSTAKAMGALVLKTFSHNLCPCMGYAGESSTDFSRRMIEIVPLLTPSALSEDWQELEELSQMLIDSLNAENCIIGRGQKDAPNAWFTMKLLSKVLEQPLDKRKPFYPPQDTFEAYQNIIDNWDTKDLTELNKMVYFLAELHIISDEYELHEYDYLMEIELSLLFPYEIAIWLKLREYKGLINPKIFTHPLMKTPIMRTFLNIKNTLPKPQGQKDLKILLELIQKMCPNNNVEIPSWLEEINAQKEKDIQTTSTQAIKNKEEEIEIRNEIIKSNQIVKKSGTYQAFLPESHPLAKKVHQMSVSKRLGVQGVSMLPLGLSPEDEDKLLWEWIGA